MNWALPPLLDPLLIKATFDGEPDKLSFFINQVWVHVDCYAPTYPDERVMVNVVAANLEGEAAEWMTSLHDEDAPELGNVDLFLEELRAKFENESQALQAEVEICDLKQRGQLVKKFVQEF